MNLFTLVATLGLDTSDFSKNIGSAVEQGKKLGSGLTKVLSVAGKTAAAFAITTTASYVTVVKKSADAVSELEQQMGGAVAVWGNYAHAIDSWAREAYKSAGLGTAEYTELSNAIGSILQGGGMDQRDAMLQTLDILQRGADLASVYGGTAADAVNAILSALRGETNPLEKYGLVVADAALEHYALEKGISKAVSKMSYEEKQLLRLQMIFDESAHAQGNFAKETETLAGSAAVMKAAWANLLDGSGTPEDFGNQLVNYIDTYMDVLKEVAPRIAKSIGVVLSTLGDRTREWLDSVGGIGGALRLALDWTLGQFNLPDSGAIVDQVTDWWTGQGENGYERVKSVLIWTLGQFEQPTEAEFYSEIETWWNTSGKAAVAAFCKWTLGEFLGPAWSDVETKVTDWWEGFSGEMQGVVKYFMDGESFAFPTWADLESAANAFWKSVKDELDKLFQISIKVGFSGGGSNLYTNTDNPLTPTGGSLFSDTWETVKTMWNVNKLKKQYGLDNVDVGGNLGSITVVNNNISSVAQNPADIGFATQQSLNRLRFG